MVRTARERRILTKHSRLFDAVEDPVDHLPACDGQEGFRLTLARGCLSRVVILGRRERRNRRLDERKEVDAEPGQDDGSELGLGQQGREERVWQHRLADRGESRVRTWFNET